jgi:hypothetical protein
MLSTDTDFDQTELKATNFLTMPPRREKLSKVEFRQLIRKKRIRFEGPVPPRQWPNEHKHHFEVVRTISDVRYDIYNTSQNIPETHRHDFRERVHYMRKRAYELLDDITTNEPTWRELETLVFKRFDEETLWYVGLTIVSCCTGTNTWTEVAIVTTNCGSLTLRPSSYIKKTRPN